MNGISSFIASFRTIITSRSDLGTLLSTACKENDSGVQVDNLNLVEVEVDNDMSQNYQNMGLSIRQLFNTSKVDVNEQIASSSLKHFARKAVTNDFFRMKNL